jgi:two-component system OmpR family sensor kinase
VTRRWLFSLRARLVLAATVAIVIAVAAFAAVAILEVRSELRGSLDKGLRQRAEQVAQLAVSAPAVLTAPGALESPVGGRQIAVEVIDAHGRILARSQTLGARLLPQDKLTREVVAKGQTGFEDVRIDGTRYRLFAAPIAQAGGPASGGAVLVASDTSDISETVSHLKAILGLSGLAVALLAAVAAALLSGQGLRPLRRLAAGAAEIERTADPAQRLPEPLAPDEIGALTGVLNRMLSSLDRARSSERRFLADASHELRTPVTALLGNVEYAQRYGANPDVLADMRHDTTRLARLVDDLLALERAGGFASPDDLVPLALDDLVRATASDRDRVAVGRLDQARVRAQELPLTRALENLIDNALVHGPPDRPVTVSLRTRGGSALLTVADEGAGPSDPERIFERFWRAPEAAGRPGSGLGLSIVKAIVEQHGGRVTVAGSVFTIELPLDAHRPGSPVEPGKRSVSA